MRVLVCGDREWSNRQLLYSVLDEINSPDQPIDAVIEGEARGADTMARQWAEWTGIPVERYPAEWGVHGRAAGPIRNKRMLVEGKPDLIVAFHDDLERSKGTAHMVSEGRRVGMAIYLIGNRTRHHIPAKSDLQA